MKNLKTTLIILALTMVMLIPTGCGSANKIESWARDYEPTEEYLALYDDGKAVFEGKDYTYVKDDDSITLPCSRTTPRPSRPMSAPSLPGCSLCCWNSNFYYLCRIL